MKRLLFASLFAIGLMFPIGSLDTELAALCATVFGLIAAGIFPAVSLLVGAPIPSSFSVQKIDEFEAATETLASRLLAALGLILIGGIAILASSFDLPTLAGLETMIPKLPASVAAWLEYLPERVIQATTFATLVMSIDRLRVVASAFLQVRKLRFEIARLSARERLADAGANSCASVASNFATDPEFGRRVAVSEAGD